MAGCAIYLTFSFLESHFSEIFVANCTLKMFLMPFFVECSHELTDDWLLTMLTHHTIFGVVMIGTIWLVVSLINKEFVPWKSPITFPASKTLFMPICIEGADNGVFNSLLTAFANICMLCFVASFAYRLAICYTKRDQCQQRVPVEEKLVGNVASNLNCVAKFSP